MNSLSPVTNIVGKRLLLNHALDTESLRHRKDLPMENYYLVTTSRFGHGKQLYSMNVREYVEINHPSAGRALVTLVS